MVTACLTSLFSGRMRHTCTHRMVNLICEKRVFILFSARAVYIDQLYTLKFSAYIIYVTCVNVGAFSIL
jgi:hypothetical protein